MWRPEGWVNPHKIIKMVDFSRKLVQTKCFSSISDALARQLEEVYEAGADAMLEELFRLAKGSPTGSFTIDSNEIHIYQAERRQKCMRVIGRLSN